MPKFQYKAVDKDGQEHTGVEEAKDAETLAEELTERGLQVSSIKTKTPITARILGGKVTIEDLVLFNRQLASMVEGELPLAPAIKAIAQEADKAQFKAVVEEVGVEVTQGKSLSDALASHPKVFPQLYVDIVKAGEKSGNVGVVLEQLADYSESMLRLEKDVRAALTYPMVVSIFALIVGWLLFWEFRPLVSGSLASAAVDLGIGRVTAPSHVPTLPAITGAVAIILICGMIALWPFLRSRRFEGVKLLLPFYKGVLQNAAVSSFSKTLSLLLHRQLPLPDALGLVASTSESTLVRAFAANAKNGVEKGETLEEHINRFWLFPNTVRWMIGAAEKRQSLPRELARLGEVYSEKAEAATRRFAAVLETFLIGAVGLLVISVAGNVFLSIRQMIAAVGGLGG